MPETRPAALWSGTPPEVERWCGSCWEELVMDYKKLGLGLGFFSIALGLAEIVAPGRLSRLLGVEGKTAKRVIGLFGARELLAGAMLLRGPAVSTNAWNR